MEIVEFDPSGGDTALTLEAYYAWLDEYYAALERQPVRFEVTELPDGSGLLLRRVDS